MDKAMTGTLASLSEQQTYPRMAKPSDFTYSPVATSQDGTETPNTLLKQSTGQVYPRCAEDGGMGKSGAGTPSLDRTAAVSAAFKVGKAPEEGTKVSNPSWVDFKTGQHSNSAK